MILSAPESQLNKEAAEGRYLLANGFLLLQLSQVIRNVFDDF